MQPKTNQSLSAMSLSEQRLMTQYKMAALKQISEKALSLGGKMPSAKALDIAVTMLAARAMREKTDKAKLPKR